MKQRTKDTVAGWLIMAAIIGVPALVGITANSFKDDEQNIKPDWSCTTEWIPYKTVAIGDNGSDRENYNLDDYDSEVIVEGQEGKTETCVDANDIEMDKTNILASPVDEVVKYTRREISIHEEPIYESGGGAICRDGWRSYSTGRGTCSHHGGVDYWL